MQVDVGLAQWLLGGMGAALAAAIGKLFLELLKAKDAHIAELQGTIKYQRSVGDHALGTAHRAVDLVERVT